MGQVETSSKSILGTFEGKSCDSNVFNNNDMHLGRELFENVLNSQEYKDGIARGHFIGFLGHPEDPGCQDFKNACIVMKDMRLDDDGNVFAKFDLIDTPVGRIVKAFQDAGVQFGISIRGAGDVAGDGEVDPDTFVFRGYDLVAFPAYNDCMPTFQAVAASSDLESKKKYKKVCAAVSKGLASITASSTLDIIQEQFRPDTNEYSLIQQRIDQLEAENTESTRVNPESTDTIVVVDDATRLSVGQDADIMEQKVDGVVSLYVDALIKNNKLEQELKEAKRCCEMQLHQMEVACDSKISRAKRIMASQLNDIQSELKSVKGSYRVSVSANTKLKDQVQSIKADANSEVNRLNIELHNLKSDNLKYRQKIESATAELEARDDKIVELKSQLSETVIASEDNNQHVSDLDMKIKSLEQKLVEADTIILKYQQAYANIYANALGVRVENLPITATTSVESLQKMITASSSTANLSTVFVEPQPVDIVDSEDIDDDDLITM